MQVRVDAGSCVCAPLDRAGKWVFDHETGKLEATVTDFGGQVRLLRRVCFTWQVCVPFCAVMTAFPLRG
jgi:hypothetical protein